MAEAIADPTLEIFDSFNDPSRWSVKRGIPCFDEHDEYDYDKDSPTYGKVIRHFGERELRDIAANCNEREANGDLCPLTDGHTVPNKPESEQPPILGYARNFRVGTFGPRKTLGILYDAWIFPQCVERANQLPRRSPEYFPRDRVFDPIAMLIRTPQRNLGVVTNYSASQFSPGMCLHYSARSRPQGRCYHYQMETDMDDVKPPLKEHEYTQIGNSPGAHEVGAEAEFSPMEHAVYGRARRYMGRHDKVYAALRQHYGAEPEEPAEVDKQEEEMFSPQEREAYAKIQRYRAKKRYGADEMVGEKPAEVDKQEEIQFSPEEHAMYARMCGYMAANDPVWGQHAKQYGVEVPTAANDYSPEEKDMYGRMSKYMAKHDRHYAAAHKKHYAAGPGMPSGTNTATPGELKPKEPVEGAGSPVPEEKVRMQRQDEAIRYHRELAQRDARIAVLEEESRGNKLKAQRENWEKTLIQYSAQGYQFDTASEMEIIEALPDDKRVRYMANLPERYKYSRSSAGHGFLPVTQEHRTSDVSEQQARAAKSLATRKKITFDEALAELK